jgi:hypothetical protein
MALDARFQRLRQSVVNGAKIAAIVTILLIVAGASLLQGIALGVAIVMFFALPSITIIVSDFFSERYLMDHVDVAVKTKSGFSKYLFIGVVQIANAIIAFFLLLLSAGGDHPENALIRGKIILVTLAATTIGALMMNTTGKAVAVALISIPLIIFFGLCV